MECCGTEPGLTRVEGPPELHTGRICVKESHGLGVSAVEEDTPTWVMYLGREYNESCQPALLAA